MSATSPLRPVLPPDIRARKGQAPLVVLTAYTTPMARLVDAHCDIALVGDSVGMVLHGLPSTLGVTMEMMILHGRAVTRGLQRAMAVIDMPFGSYEESPAQAFANAARLMVETGAAAVKLEGGARMAETIAFLTQRGVPVMAHIGLTPPAVNTLGGYRVQGRTESGAEQLMQDAIQLQHAGAQALVLEMVPADVSAELTQALQHCATIGIGAGKDTAGQVLVLHDMLGVNLGKMPKFVRNFMLEASSIRGAMEAYVAAVKDGSFPVNALHAW